MRNPAPHAGCPRGTPTGVFHRAIDDEDYFPRIVWELSEAETTAEEEMKMRFNWKRWNATALAGALFLIMALVGFSQGPPGRPPGPPPDGFRRGPGPRDGLGPLTRDLNLTDDQKAQIKKITDSFEAGTKDLHDQLRTLHESEPDPLSGGTFDEAAVRSAAEARSHVEVELAVAHAKMMSQIAAVLTTDQKAQLAARRKQFGPKPPPPPEPPQ